MGVMVVVGDVRRRGNIPISEGSFNIPTPTFMENWTISPTKGTLDPRYGVQNTS